MKAAFKNPLGPNVSANTLACMDQMMDLWTLDNIKAVWNNTTEPTYKWGLTHGDFHPGQVMFNTGDLTDMLMLDWEFAGIMGSPGQDMASWMALIPNSFATLHERDMVEAYWLALIEEGVSGEDYPFEQLWYDYGVFGAGAIFTRFIYFGGFMPYDPAVRLITKNIDAFFERHDLTPEMMQPPMYTIVDDYV